MLRIKSAVHSIVRDSLFLYLELLKIMVPVMILVKIATEFGVVKFISPVFEPLMIWVGLPPIMGLVWVTTIFVNPYAGAVVLLELLPDNPLTSAQITVLGTMMLMAHSLPVEGRIIQKAGGGVLLLNLIRIGSALILGGILSYCFQVFSILQGPAETVFSLNTKSDVDLGVWIIDALDTLVKIFFIILILLSLLRLLDFLGITRNLISALRPVLRILGLSDGATQLIVSGALLGLAFGGALIIEEARKKTLAPKDIYLSLVFLCLCHGLIEDTIFIMTLGAHLSGLLFARVIFTLIFMYFFARLIHAMPDRIFRYLCSLQKST